ncbi:uncharacterized protein METZ01_LOCUS352892 [marine metagenome]|uniref:Uncharacterized protein n=1 Tax=marine metagenome TaxID=408172 RepID=A0A382RSV6_9ZZZZ
MLYPSFSLEGKDDFANNTAAETDAPAEIIKAKETDFATDTMAIIGPADISPKDVD